MNLFPLVKQLLLQIQQTDALQDLKLIKPDQPILLLRYVSERGMEQDILAKTLKPIIDRKEMPENFYAYLLWIAGELMNNVFDHGQTLGRTLKGGILALNVKNNIAELAIGDLGIGIKSSLEKNPQIQIKKIDAKQAIQLALTENTSGWPHKRGNGLPDILRLVRAGKGKIKIYSDQIIWTEANGQDKWEDFNEKLDGVIVACELEINDFRVPRKSRPKGEVIKLSQFGRQLSGRDKGQEAYEVLIRKLTELPKDGILLLDLTDIVMMNSSFGDQALGVLLENIKQGHFGGKKVFFTGKISEPVDLCLDRIAEIRDVETVKV